MDATISTFVGLFAGLFGFTIGVHIRRDALVWLITVGRFMAEENHFRSILLFGPPGVGKGTQGKSLASIPGFYHFSIGDVFRAINTDSPEGKEISHYTSQGRLVPDDLTVRIWAKALDAYVALSKFKPREDLLIVDGIPRNIAQTDLIKDHIEIVQIINLDCDNDDEMIKRMHHRAIRENREDDSNEEVIRNRFGVFREISKPVLDCYPPEIISSVNALCSPAEVLRSILEFVIPTQNEHYEIELKLDAG